MLSFTHFFRNFFVTENLDSANFYAFRMYEYFILTAHIHLQQPHVNEVSRIIWVEIADMLVNNLTAGARTAMMVGLYEFHTMMIVNDLPDEVNDLVELLPARDVWKHLDDWIEEIGDQTLVICVSCQSACFLLTCA